MSNQIENLIKSMSNDSFKMGVVSAFLTINLAINNLLKRDNIKNEIGIKAINEIIQNELNKKEYEELLVLLNENI